MWRIRTCLALLGVLAAACGGPASSSGPTTTRDAALDTALTTYVVEFLRRFPTVNTYLGGGGLEVSLADVDGTLRDYSPGALDREDRWLDETLKTITAFDPATLSNSGQINRAVALAQIEFMLHQHRVRHYQQRALDTYVSEPFRAIDWQLQGMTPTGGATYGTDAEWTLLVRRVRAVPFFLELARQQLQVGVAAGNTPDERMLRRDGIAAAEATARYFSETLPRVAAERLAGDRRVEFLAAVTDAGRRARAAYDSFRAFVAATYFEDASAQRVKPRFGGDRFALGESEYDWALDNNLRLGATAAQLFADAWPIVQNTQTDMIEIAREIGARRGWTLPADGPSAVRAVFDELAKDSPRSDAEMIGWFRDAAFRLVDYGRGVGLFDIPADYRLDVVETPPPLQSSIDGAAYYPAPPFKKTGVGRFYVTPTHNDQAALMASNRAAIADLSAHEGFPGHDWHFKVMAQYGNDIAPVRWLTPGAVEDSSAMWEDSMAAEGWGLYAEGLPAEPQPNAIKGFYSPEEHLYQLQGELYRDLRVRIDTGIHTDRLGYDEATTLYSEVVDFLPGSCAPSPQMGQQKRASCEAAERAVFRYSKWPTQAITYRLGRDQIVAMRDDARTTLGAAFSPRAFHLAFMKQGTIPPGYFRELLLRELQVQK